MGGFLDADRSLVEPTAGVCSSFPMRDGPVPLARGFLVGVAPYAGRFRVAYHLRLPITIR
jgi:hypothetical protein